MLNSLHRYRFPKEGEPIEKASIKDVTGALCLYLRELAVLLELNLFSRINSNVSLLSVINYKPHKAFHLLLYSYNASVL